MVQACQRTRLIHKACERVGVVLLGLSIIQRVDGKRLFTAVGTKHGHIFLYYHMLLAFDMLSQVGDAEPSLPDFADNEVFAQLHPLRQCYSVC